MTGVLGEPEPPPAVQVGPRRLVVVPVAVPGERGAGADIGGDPVLRHHAAAADGAGQRVAARAGARGVHRPVGQRGVADLRAAAGYPVTDPDQLIRDLALPLEDPQPPVGAGVDQVQRAVPVEVEYLRVVPKYPVGITDIEVEVSPGELVVVPRVDLQPPPGLPMEGLPAWNTSTSSRPSPLKSTTRTPSSPSDAGNGCGAW